MAMNGEAVGKLAPRQAVADFSLLAVTVVWGVTFVVVKNALADIGPFWFIGIRFSLAFVLLMAVYWGRLQRVWRTHAITAGKVGTILFLGFCSNDWPEVYNGFEFRVYHRLISSFSPPCRFRMGTKNARYWHAAWYCLCGRRAGTLDMERQFCLILVISGPCLQRWPLPCIL